MGGVANCSGSLDSTRLWAVTSLQSSSALWLPCTRWPVVRAGRRRVFFSSLVTLHSQLRSTDNLKCMFLLMFELLYCWFFCCCCIGCCTRSSGWLFGWGRGSCPTIRVSTGWLPDNNTFSLFLIDEGVARVLSHTGRTIRCSTSKCIFSVLFLGCWVPPWSGVIRFGIVQRLHLPRRLGTDHNILLRFGIVISCGSNPPCR